MRKAIALMLGCFAGLAGWAQTITVKVNGTKNQQLVIDGRTYTIDNNRGSEKTITITDLLPGQHSIRVVRNNRTNTTTTTNFTTRAGYETMLNIAANGSVHVREKAGSTATSSIRTPMTDREFTTLLQRTRNHVRNTSRINAVATALANPNYYFTTAQLRMLLESFDGEVNRLDMARQAFPKVTDQLNFATLNSLFTIQANRDALSAYIRSQGGDIAYSYSESFRMPMRATNFDAIINNVEAQWQEGARLSSIIDVMENSNNYFSAAQALELIQLVADQSSRLHLAKAVYSRLTDPENFSSLYPLFTDDYYLNNLKAYVNANANNMAGVHNYGKQAMTDADFNKLYNSSRSHFRTSSILRDVTNALNNTNNFFTSYQVRQMISLVRTENDRLQLAKSAYRGVVDAHNYLTQMNDLFQWQESRDQLADYISDYRPQ